MIIGEQIICNGCGADLPDGNAPVHAVRVTERVMCNHAVLTTLHGEDHVYCDKCHKRKFISIHRLKSNFCNMLLPWNRMSRRARNIWRSCLKVKV